MGTSREQTGPAVATIWSHPLKALHDLCLCKENNKPLCIEPRKILHPYRVRENQASVNRVRENSFRPFHLKQLLSRG